jgi:lipoprotein-releasing system permease protein
MHWTRSLSKRLINNTKKKSQFSNSIVKLNKTAIALSVAVMLLSSFLIRGFEQKIESKIFDFWANIHILPFSFTNNFLEAPLQADSTIIQILKDNSEVEKIAFSANKGVILKKSDNIEGLILKGIDLETSSFFYTQYVKPNLNQLNNLDTNTIPIFISKKTAASLNLKKMDYAFLSFLNESLSKTKKCRVIDVFSTGIAEFDQQNIITQIEYVQKLNHWKTNQYSAIEVYVKDKSKIESTAETLYNTLPNLNVSTIYSIFPQLFDWLKLMTQNERIIIFIMLIVAMINIISSMSIFILERVNLIGLLKVFGADNSSIFKLFLFQIIQIILQGLFWGNIIAFVLAFLQYKFHIITLQEDIYYVDYAPVYFDWIKVLWINLLTLIVCFITTFVPLIFITKISPVKIAEYK